MMKVERRNLCERNRDHSPGQWFGPHALTWVRAPWGWMLATVTPIEPDGSFSSHVRGTP